MGGGMGRVSGRVAIVTGAARGIGHAIARRLALEGASVLVADIDERAGDEAAQAIGAEVADIEGVVAAHPVDVADAASVATMVAACEARLGRPDVLVNNAGVATFHDPLEMPPEAWAHCMSVDLEGAWHCARAVLPGMLDAGSGAIVNVISNHATQIIPSTFPYPVAKHGLLGLTRALALQYAGRGISVNAISPGWTDTAIAEADFARTGDAVAARAKVEALQPPGRLCRPDEIAAVALLLASDEARFIVGENIVVDGGVGIRMYDSL